MSRYEIVLAYQLELAFIETIPNDLPAAVTDNSCSRKKCFKQCYEISEEVGSKGFKFDRAYHRFSDMPYDHCRKSPRPRGHQLCTVIPKGALLLASLS